MVLDSRLERYRSIATLGAGGMASVVLAEDTILGRQVALKRMHPATADPRGVLRLRREALVGASMSHPNLVSIYDVIESEDGNAFIAMGVRARRDPWRCVEPGRAAGSSRGAAGPGRSGRRPVTAAGLMVIALTGGPAGDAGRSSLAALIALEAGVFAASSLLVAASIKLVRLHPGEGLVLGAAAGCLFGVSDIALKFLAHAADAGLTSALISPWTLAAVAASLVAFYSSARSLQVGPALAVIAFTSIAANLIAISGGILVFHDSIGVGAAQIVERMLAFCLVIAGAALMPAPTRARATGTEPASTQPSPARSPSRIAHDEMLEAG